VKAGVRVLLQTAAQHQGFAIGLTRYPNTWIIGHEKEPESCSGKYRLEDVAEASRLLREFRGAGDTFSARAAGILLAER
jgi:hypothetical protein